MFQQIAKVGAIAAAGMVGFASTGEAEVRIFRTWISDAAMDVCGHVSPPGCTNSFGSLLTAHLRQTNGSNCQRTGGRHGRHVLVSPAGRAGFASLNAETVMPRQAHSNPSLGL
jgi:hypothetical protein